MKALVRWTLVALVLLASTGAGFAADKPIVIAPRAVLAEGVFDFGAVVEGTRISHDFVLKNTGRAPLHIGKLEAG